MGDYNRNAETNAITITPDPNSQEAFLSSIHDQSIWATEDDYSNCENPSETFSSSSYDGGRQAQSRSASDQPPNKKPRTTQGDSQVSAVGGSATTSRSRAIGKMFFKTKLCCKFRAGTCPYITNCNFAHGIEELRKPPPNWQEIVASQDDGSGVSEFKEEPQQAIPIVLSSSNIAGEVQRSYKGRHCKKFYTEEGCLYGDVCTFMHDEQSKSRESVAINLGPTTGIGPAYGNEAAGLSQKPSNWKTRICNKWEMTGYCPFGSKCHFAHGATELHRYGGGLVEMDGRDNSSAGGGDSKQSGVNGGTLSSKPLNDTAMTTTNSMMAHTDIYHLGVSSQRQAVGSINPRQGQRPLQKWKGPNKISMIYGDWIVEND